VSSSLCFSGAGTPFGHFALPSLAQWIVDCVLWMHFMRPVFVIEAFDALRMIVLLAVTSALGFMIGYVLSLLWNVVYKNPA